MTDLQILRDVLNDGLFIQLEPDGQEYTVKLVEKDPSAKLKKVILEGLHANTVILKIDKTNTQKVFKAGRGQLKRCDYLIFTKINNRRYAFFIELKSRNKDEYIKQFKGAECIVDYCDSVLNRFYNKTGLLAQFEKRFVLFYKTSIDKRPTRPSPPVMKNDSPEKSYKYSDPHTVRIDNLVRL